MSGMFSMGPHLVTLRVRDRAGATSTDDVIVAVVDTLAPQISVEMTPTVLWPPDRRMVNVSASISATDMCGTPTVVLSSVTSNQGDRGPGPGSNVQGASLGASDLELSLRAERDGNGASRIYTISYTATDTAGNSASATCTIVVPHDQRGAGESRR